MNFCLYNAIKTPDGTILNCTSGYDYKTYFDTVSQEQYMNDGLGYGIRRSVNKIPYEDLAVFDNSPHEQVRVVKFWTSYGKDGKSPGFQMSLEDMETAHIKAILDTQKKIQDYKHIFENELKYRNDLILYKTLENFENKEKKVKQKKI